MLEKAREYFGAFNMEPHYEIDKSRLRQSYYILSKALHPDTSALRRAGPSPDSALLNAAYANLKDDFLRAKLFTTPSQAISPDFLTGCLELEERIDNGEDIGQLLDDRMAECQLHFAEPIWLARWGYYRRLKGLLREATRQ